MKGYGKSCGICGDCADAECGLGKGMQCCGGKCDIKTKDYTGGYYCKGESKGVDGLHPPGTSHLSENKI